jgi:hypothetical protein
MTPSCGTAAGGPRCFLERLRFAAAGGMQNAAERKRSIVKSTNEVRAAVTGHNVRYVLLVGTLAVIVLFAVAYVAARL